MRRSWLGFAVGFALLATAGMAQDGPYKVLKTAKVGGLGGFDYINADSVGTGCISRAARYRVRCQPLQG